MHDPDQITALRRTAEQEGSDADLLELRSLERAVDALPPLIDGVRRVDLLWADPIASTWSGWDVCGGQRVLLRCLRAEWRSDRIMRRRMARAALGMPSLRVPTWHSDGDWPHLRLELGGPLLTDGLPDESESSVIAAILTRTLAGLTTLHAGERHLGGVLEEHIVLTESGPEMLWMDRFSPPGSMADDLAALGRLAQRLSPTRHDPLARVVADWADCPPPAALDGVALLRQAMSQTLLTHRHRLRQVHRSNAHLSDVRRLQKLTERLVAWPPPAGVACLSANDPNAPILLRSNGDTIHAGSSATEDLVFTPEDGLNMHQHRTLARAWRRRSASMEPQRLAIQIEQGGAPGDAEPLLRWMTARAELRTLRLLMERATR